MEKTEETKLQEQPPPAELGGGDDWTKEQTEELIFMIQDKISTVKPEDTMSFRVRMKVLTWGDLPSMLHPPRTEQECKDQLHHIVENTKTLRNLSEMLRAYKNKPRQRKCAVVPPIKRFMQERGEEIRKMKGNWITNARAAFEALTEEERRQYTEPYNNEKARMKALQVKPTRSTFKIFCETLTDECKHEEKKKKFQALTPEERLPLIKQALKEYKQSLRAFEDQHKEDEDLKSKPPCIRLTKEEWRIFLESKGMPVLRAVSPYQLYLLDHDDSDDAGTGKSSLQRYHDFVRSSDHAQYERKFKQELVEFGRKFQTWYAAVQVEAWKEPAHTYYTEMTTSKGGVKKTGFNFKVASKVIELEQSYVESSMVSKFNDEPVPAPLSARGVFKHYVMAKTPGTPKNEMNNAWNNLSDDHKQKFTDVAATNIKHYKESLKDYVKNLSDQERRVYIGQNRVRFIRLFEGTDIFEKHYPCTQYPPFRTPARNEKKSPPKRVVSSSRLDIDIGSILKPATNGTEEEEEDSDSGEEEELPKKDISFSEESFKGRLPSTSTPGVAASKGTHAAKQKKVSNSKKQQESDSESSSSESSEEDAKGAGNNSTLYLENVQKVHTKKLLPAQSESESDGSSDSEEVDSPKPVRPATAVRSPAVRTTPKQPAARATAPESTSSGESSSSSSDDDTPASKIGHTSKNSSPHGILPMKKTPKTLSSKNHAASSSKAPTSTPITKLHSQSPKVQAQPQAESSSSSESSDSEEESPPAKVVVKSSPSGRKKSSLPPPEDSSSEEEDIDSAWA